MSILDQAHQLANAGRIGDAVALIERAADAQDAEAQYALANWRLFGLNGPRDIKRAHELLRRAGEKGHVEALRTRAFLLVNGTGIASDTIYRATLTGLTVPWKIGGASTATIVRRLQLAAGDTVTAAMTYYTQSSATDASGSHAFASVFAYLGYHKISD